MDQKITLLPQNESQIAFTVSKVTKKSDESVVES